VESDITSVWRTVEQQVQGVGAAGATLPLARRLNVWRLEGVLAEHAALKAGRPQVRWPALPPDLPVAERAEALEIVAEWDKELAEFPQRHPDLWAAIKRRRGGQASEAD